MKSGQGNTQTSVFSNKEGQPATNKNKRAINKKPQQNFSNDVQCGVSMVGLTQSLAYGGDEISHGEWPWYVYINLKIIQLMLVTYRKKKSYL